MEHSHNYPDVFTTSTETKNIVGAILKFNKSIGVIDKDAKNPFFRSDYAPLPTILKDIKQPMQDAGLTINHFPAGDNCLVTRLSHSSGEFYQCLTYMKAVKDTPQDRGSVITYMMRYNVGAVLGLAIDKDDDANKSSQAPQQSEPQLKTLSATVKDTMLKYISEGNVDAVKKQLPKYSKGANYTIVDKAIKDADNVQSLSDTADDIAKIDV